MRKHIHWLIALVAGAFVAGLYVGDMLGRRIGYECGVIDHTDELVQSADSLRAVYQRKADELTIPYDTIEITEKTYILTPSTNGN